MASSSSLVSAKWLRSALPMHARVLDCSSFVPSANPRFAAKEFQSGHIPMAQFFDLDATSLPSPLPHMMPELEHFRDAVEKLGVSKTIPSGKPTVLYDSQGMFSAPRVWFMFRHFDYNDAFVLNGGLPAWLEEKFPLEKDVRPCTRGVFPIDPKRVRDDIVDYDAIIRNISSREFTLVDARAAPRFSGTAPEPRASLLVGHVPGAINVPWSSLMIDSARPELGLKERDKLRVALSGVLDSGKPVVTMCGSGVTACVVNLALHELGVPSKLYDGSWAEYGNKPNSPIERHS